MWFRLPTKPGYMKKSRRAKWHEVYGNFDAYGHFGQCGMSFDSFEKETRDNPPPPEDTCKWCLRVRRQKEDQR